MGVSQKVIENHFIELVLKWNKFLKQQHHQLGNQMQKHQHVIHVMFHSHYLIEDTTADIVVKDCTNYQCVIDRFNMLTEQRVCGECFLAIKTDIKIEIPEFLQTAAGDLAQYCN